MTELRETRTAPGRPARVWVADEAGRRASATVAADGRVATITLTIPCGSVATGVRRFLPRAQTRAAGATCMIDAHLTLDGGSP
jgi:hypothetical protein